ncbi:protein POLYCHOME-like [Malania oleifera]|uniref:protein POLYCHOME-like n=1 Tax=Malania oleifera TaxID=397392 RepID=UPI0025AE9CD0|nr:protein POLYCHOME-like [Malania oleifera]
MAFCPRSPSVGRENLPARSSRRGGVYWTSVLPSWYPRTPLRDITAIVRAIERRRAHQGEMEDQKIESPTPQCQNILGSSALISSPHLKNNISMISPCPSAGMKLGTPSICKIPKTLVSVMGQTAEASDFLTPQKEFLNSIDTVGKLVMEELQELERTPSAKKADKEKRMRTLMSMR